MTGRWSISRPRLARLGASANLLLATASLAGCSVGNSSFLAPHGPIAAAQRGHYWLVVAVVMIVVLPVILLTPLIVWRYRYGNRKAAYRPKWDFSLPLDILIWGVPFAIVALLAYVLWMSTSSLDPYRPLASEKEPLKVQVVGMDWKWLFIYPEQGIASVDRLVFPADRPVSFELTSATVLQSFFIPALGGQIDAMNRMVTRLHLAADAPGSFQGKNMQYNGRDFHRQHFTALAVDAAAFAAFVKGAREEGLPLGRRQYAILSRPGTADEAAKALGVPQPDGTFRFAQVPAGLFAAIVKDGPIDWAALDHPSSATHPPGASAMRDGTAAAPDPRSIPAHDEEAAQ